MSWKILLVSGMVGISLSILVAITAASCMTESEEQYYYQPVEQQNQPAAPAGPTSTPRPVTVANERINLEPGEWTEYSIARYRYCDYEISADTLDIEVDGVKGEVHRGSTKSNVIEISNEYSMFAPKSVKVYVECHR